MGTIENNIKENFAMRLLQSNPLFPKPPLYLENWPWPVQIHIVLVPCWLDLWTFEAVINEAP
jgi:hypothetical protein